MRGPWCGLVLLLACVVGPCVLPGARATEVVPPSRPCVLVNDYKEIFVGRVTSRGHRLTAYVQVLRTYKGSVSGEVVVTTSPTDLLVGSAGFDEGETYIFYSSGPDKDPSLGRVVTFWSTKPLSGAKPEELKLLKEINQPPYTGNIFGTLDRHLTALERTPMPNVKILVAKGGKTYSGTTDRKGNFEISGLPNGTYRIGADLPDAFTLELDTNNQLVRVEPHGCLEADLVALNNATIRGRITLPGGQKVEGTKVYALSTPGGGSDVTGVADRNGRYEIVGLSPGEYVVGVNLGFDFSRAEAPFPATYFPGTRNLDEAKRFVVQGPAHFSHIDFSVPVAEEIVNLKVKATFEDGRPVQNQAIGLSDTGYGIRGGKDTDAQGMASLPVVRGERYIVMAYSGTDRGCPTPVTVGPENYPDVVHLVYSNDGCREAYNVTSAGMLRASVHSNLSQVPVTVSWSDGSPAYEANVTVMSDRHSTPFVAVFQTGKDGRVDVPIPLNQEFRIKAEVICSNTGRDSQTLLFDTQSGIRWREFDPHQQGTSEWNSLTTPASPTPLVLQGSPCRSGSQSK